MYDDDYKRFVSESEYAAEFGDAEDCVLNAPQDAVFQDGVYGFLIPCPNGQYFPEAQHVG